MNNYGQSVVIAVQLCPTEVDRTNRNVSCYLHQYYISAWPRACARWRWLTQSFFLTLKSWMPGAYGARLSTSILCLIFFLSARRKKRWSQRVTFRAAAYCQNACGRRVHCKRVSNESVGTEHVLKAFTSYSSAGPECAHTTMCRWVPAVFSATPNPSAASSVHNVNNTDFFSRREVQNN